MVSPPFTIASTSRTSHDVAARASIPWEPPAFAMRRALPFAFLRAIPAEELHSHSHHTTSSASCLETPSWKYRVEWDFIAYFEVSIVRRPDAELPPTFHPFGLPPCVSVGLADGSFPLASSQVGWRRGSFGYHGDDGHFFCEVRFDRSEPLHSRVSRRLRCMVAHCSVSFVLLDVGCWQAVSSPYGPEFGAGDTIGCAFNLWTHQVFYTRNGEPLGMFSHTLPQATCWPA